MYETYGRGAGYTRGPLDHVPDGVFQRVRPHNHESHHTHTAHTTTHNNTHTTSHGDRDRERRDSHIPTLVGERLVKRGVSRGPIRYGRGPLSPVAILVNLLHRLGPTRTCRTPCRCRALRALMEAAMYAPAPAGVDTAPLHRAYLSRVYDVGGPHKTATLITVVPAASAATAAVVYREVVDGKRKLF